jgi:hypothetical protein
MIKKNIYMISIETEIKFFKKKLRENGAAMFSKISK